MRSSDITAAVAHRWVDAWTTGDLTAVQLMLSDRVSVEHNLDLPAERSTLVSTIRSLADALDEAAILSLTTTEGQAALLYDCRLREPRARATDGIRLAEFLDVDEDRIAGIRRVYDLTAVDRLLPSLRDRPAG